MIIHSDMFNIIITITYMLKCTIYVHLAHSKINLLKSEQIYIFLNNSVAPNSNERMSSSLYSKRSQVSGNKMDM